MPLRKLSLPGFLLFSLLSILLSIVAAAQNDRLPRSSPEEEGVGSRAVLRFLEAVKESGLEFHSFMFLRHGKVIAEGWWDPYRPGLRHSLYSVSKSFTSTAVGFAVSEGRLALTDKVISFFPDDLPDSLSPYLSELTVRDLLTMSSGHDPDPTGEVIAHGMDNWAKRFLRTPLVHEPGTKFVYNTIATYMLSAILQKLTGQKLVDYLEPRLFVPLGIRGMDWEESPQHINTGGFGLRIKTEDMAKFGQLYLQNGSWKGRQVLPAAWVREATRKQIESAPAWIEPGTPGDSSDWLQGYGYQFWRSRHNLYRADGLAGQLIIMMPEEDAVVVLTAEIAAMQKEYNLVSDYLLPAMHTGKLPADAAGLAALKQRLSSLALPPPGQTASSRISTGISSDVSSAAAKALSGRVFGIGPNPRQIKRLSFRLLRVGCQLSIETDTAVYRIPFGAGRWVKSETMKRGPYGGANQAGLLPYKVAGSYAWKDANTLELVLRYIETPHSEKISCHFEGDKISVVIRKSYPFGAADDETVLEGKALE